MNAAAKLFPSVSDLLGLNTPTDKSDKESNTTTTDNRITGQNTDPKTSVNSIIYYGASCVALGSIIFFYTRNHSFPMNNIASLFKSSE